MKNGFTEAGMPSLRVGKNISWQHESEILPSLASGKKSDNQSALKRRQTFHARPVRIPPRKTFGRNVNRLRMRRQLTQDDLAETAQIDRRYVQRIENGTANPGLDVICRVKKALRASWDELLRGVLQ